MIDSIILRRSFRSMVRILMTLKVPVDYINLPVFYQKSGSFIYVGWSLVIN